MTELKTFLLAVLLILPSPFNSYIIQAQNINVPQLGRLQVAPLSIPPQPMQEIKVPNVKFEVNSTVRLLEIILGLNFTAEVPRAQSLSQRLSPLVSNNYV